MAAEQNIEIKISKENIIRLYLTEKKVNRKDS